MVRLAFLKQGIVQQQKSGATEVFASPYSTNKVMEFTFLLSHP